jgi:hypothetical protein
VLKAWDFSVGTHFFNEMYIAAQYTDRTIGILSRLYLESEFGQAEWQEAWRLDPTGTKRKLLMFRIEDCPRPAFRDSLSPRDRLRNLASEIEDCLGGYSLSIPDAIALSGFTDIPTVFKWREEWDVQLATRYSVEIHRSSVSCMNMHE